MSSSSWLKVLYEPRAEVNYSFLNYCYLAGLLICFVLLALEKFYKATFPTIEGLWIVFSFCIPMFLWARWMAGKKVNVDLNPNRTENEAEKDVIINSVLGSSDSSDSSSNSNSSSSSSSSNSNNNNNCSEQINNLDDKSSNDASDPNSAAKKTN